MLLLKVRHLRAHANYRLHVKVVRLVAIAVSSKLPHTKLHSMPASGVIYTNMLTFGELTVLSRASDAQNHQKIKPEEKAATSES